MCIYVRTCPKDLHMNICRDKCWIIWYIDCRITGMGGKIEDF